MQPWLRMMKMMVWVALSCACESVWREWRGDSAGDSRRSTPQDSLSEFQSVSAM